METPPTFETRVANAPSYLAKFRIFCWIPSKHLPPVRELAERNPSSREPDLAGEEGKAEAKATLVNGRGWKAPHPRNTLLVCPLGVARGNE